MCTFGDLSPALSKKVIDKRSDGGMDARIKVSSFRINGSTSYEESFENPLVLQYAIL